ncbi:MAG TPA: hypothetical protein DEG09_02295, partial [Marinilabiliaceae bacterium]|nr:hypothetical protein [Marinilabiliaceae bacterium]
LRNQQLQIRAGLLLKVVLQLKPEQALRFRLNVRCSKAVQRLREAQPPSPLPAGLQLHAKVHRLHISGEVHRVLPHVVTAHQAEAHQAAAIHRQAGVHQAAQAAATHHRAEAHQAAQAAVHRAAVHQEVAVQAGVAEGDRLFYDNK